MSNTPTPYVPTDGAILCIYTEVPEEGWEWRRGPGLPWLPGSTFVLMPIESLVEARPIPAEPVTVTIPRDLAEAFARMTWISTTAIRMRHFIDVAFDTEDDQ